MSHRLLLFAALGFAAVSGALAASSANGLLPAAPTGMTAGAIGPSQIYLQWVDNSDNEDAFEIERSSDGGRFVLIAAISAGTTDYVDSEVAPAKTHAYQIRAVNQSGASPYATVGAVPTIPPPPGTTCLEVTRPWRGDIWPVGSNRSIMWSGPDAGADVKIAISYDKARTFQSIVAKTPNDGRYDWQVVGAVTTRASILISSVLDPGCRGSSSPFEIINPDYSGTLMLPRRLRLGAASIGSTKMKALVLRNTSQTESLQATVTMVRVSNPAFSGHSGFGTVVISPGSSHVAWVAFTPSRAWKQWGKIIVDSSDRRKSLASVNLVGFGVKWRPRRLFGGSGQFSAGR